jgi:hypothetical protein
MPTVMRIGKYRFFFYANENDEPYHIHVKAGNSEAKYWLQPTGLAWSVGFNERELSKIERHIADNLNYIIEAWNTFFGGDNE